ncbi:MAG: lamin tail domain-containing protein, partial [Patescibacteria group bacterium]
ETIPSDPVVADAVIDDEPIVDDSNVGTTLGLSEPEEPQNEITPTVTEPIVDELIVETPIETIVDELDVRVGSPDPVIETVIAPTVLPGDIIITEICSNPNEDNEWVEIKNVSATAINLLNWNIQDASGKNVLFPEVSLESSSVFVLENIKMLNNDGDAVTLMDSTGQTIDSMAYGTEQISAPKKGESIARFANSWSVSINPTPGAENVAVADEVTTTTETYEEQTPNQVQTIESTASQVAPASSNGSSTHAGTASVVSDPASTVHKIVAVAEPAKTAATKSTTTKSTSSSSKTSSLESRTGVVTALPGTFGDQIAYIDGIQLYFYTKDWPTLHLGDEIRVLGTLSESYGEARLKISTKDNITILSQTTLTPRVLSIAEAKTQNTGALVQITGEITERTGNNLVVQFGEDAITVVAHEKTGIAWTDFTGTAITVTGIVRQINGEAKLYPRSVNDVRIEEIKTISATSSVLSFQEFTPWIGGALVLGVSSFLAYWYIRSKQISILNTSTT